MNDTVKNYLILKVLDQNFGIGTGVRLLVHWFLYIDSIKNLGT